MLQFRRILVERPLVAALIEQLAVDVLQLLVAEGVVLLHPVLLVVVDIGRIGILIMIRGRIDLRQRRGTSRELERLPLGVLDRHFVIVRRNCFHHQDVCVILLLLWNLGHFVVLVIQIGHSVLQFRIDIREVLSAVRQHLIVVLLDRSQVLLLPIHVDVRVDRAGLNRRRLQHLIPFHKVLLQGPLREILFLTLVLGVAGDGSRRHFAMEMKAIGESVVVQRAPHRRIVKRVAGKHVHAVALVILVFALISFAFTRCSINVLSNDSVRCAGL